MSFICQQSFESPNYPFCLCFTFMPFQLPQGSGLQYKKVPAPSCSILCLGPALLCEIGKSQFSSLCLLSPHCSEWILWRGLLSFFLPRPPLMAWN